MATFEGYERREAKILGVLAQYGISSIDECKKICDERGIAPGWFVTRPQPVRVDVGARFDARASSVRLAATGGG